MILLSLNPYCLVQTPWPASSLICNVLTFNPTLCLSLTQFPITALREIKILQLLKHENVVNLIEICRTKGKVLDLVPFSNGENKAYNLRLCLQSWNQTHLNCLLTQTCLPAMIAFSGPFIVAGVFLGPATAPGSEEALRKYFTSEGTHRWMPGVHELGVGAVFGKMSCIWDF